MIISDIPGTTRDMVQESLNIHGLPIVLIDTAGIHNTDDHIEMQGLKRTHDTIAQADMVLMVMEAKHLFSEPDLQIFKKLENKNVLIVINKIDLLDDSGRDTLPCEYQGISIVPISALYRKGIDRLEEQIVAIITGNDEIVEQGELVPNLRHMHLLKNVLESVNDATRSLKSGVSSEMIVLDLNRAIRELDEIIGLNIVPDVLEKIFSRFCIGK